MKATVAAFLIAISASAHEASITFSCERNSDVSKAPAFIHPTAMTALLAKPKAFDGKRVSFTGVMRFQFDRFAVFPSIDLARIEDMPSSITAEVPACVTEEQFSRLDALDGHYVRVSGVFDSKAPGYGGVAAGSLVKVYEVMPAEPLAQTGVRVHFHDLRALPRCLPGLPSRVRLTSTASICASSLTDPSARLLYVLDLMASSWAMSSLRDTNSR